MGTVAIVANLSIGHSGYQIYCANVPGFFGGAGQDHLGVQNSTCSVHYTCSLVFLWLSGGDKRNNGAKTGLVEFESRWVTTYAIAYSGCGLTNPLVNRYQRNGVLQGGDRI